MNPNLSNAVAVESAVSHVPHGLPHVGGVHPVAPTKTEIGTKAAAEANDARQAPQTAEQKAATKLQGVKTTFMMPAQYEFFGMLGGGGLGWIAKKLNWQRAQAAVEMVARAPVHGMRRTTLAESLQLPANILKEASNEAANVGGKAAPWAEAILKRSSAWRAHAVGVRDAEGNVIKDGLEQKIAKHAEPHLKRIGKHLDNLQETEFGKAAQKHLSGFMKSRHTSAINSHNAALEKAQQAVTTEKTGFITSAKNFITRTKPSAPSAEVPAGLEELFADLKKAGTLSGTEKTKHLSGLIDSLEKQMRGDALEKGAKARAGEVMKHLQKALSSAGALETYEHAVGNSATLRTMATALAKAGGRIPVFNALLSVGVTAGIGAVLVTAHGESKEAKAAFKKLNTELSDAPNSGFMKAVKAAQKKAGKWSSAKTGMRMVGEVAEGSMWMMPNGGGASMMGAMMLPQLCEMMVPGNTLLGALEALDKGDKGQVALKPSDRIQLMSQLIGSMDTVASHGGQYNRLAKAMAAEMQERGYKYHDLVQLLGNDAAFSKFAAEVGAKQQEEAANIAAEAKAAEPVKAPSIASGPTGPTTRIGVGAAEAHHKGMVVDNRQLAMA